MKRRDFIKLLGGAASAWPMAAGAQQPSVPVIGFLHGGSPEVTPSLVAAFRKGLSETGFVEGRNVSIEFRWANNDTRLLPELAADLVRRGVRVIATPNGETAALAAKAATSSIPILFNSTDDPVKVGLVASYNRPEGNLTGVVSMAQNLGAKRLGLLHELLPRATRFAVLVGPNADGTAPFLADLREAAPTIGAQIESITAGSVGELDLAFETAEQMRADALLTAPSALFGARRLQLAIQAARHSIPAMYHDRLFTESGGLMSYGTSLADVYRQVGVYTGRVLKGAKPSELPVLQPTKFEFVISLQAARTIGLTVPPTLLAIADEVIE
jgi:putative ABC transport system substrate-binding protein